MVVTRSCNPSGLQVFKLGVGGKPEQLQGDELNLAQLEIFPDQEVRMDIAFRKDKWTRWPDMCLKHSFQIRVVDSGAVDGSDLSFLEAGANSGKSRRGPETGFKNTLLTSGGGAGVGHANRLKGDDDEEGEASPAETECISQEL